MMGEEPLEVPTTHPHHTQTQPSVVSQLHYRSQIPSTQQLQLLDHQLPNTSIQPPELSSNWPGDSTERACSRERIVNAFERAQQQQQISQVSGGAQQAKQHQQNTRRTRHRVDAGEPRGCFNTNPNVPNLQGHWGGGGHHRTTQYTNRFVPHFLHHHPGNVGQNQNFINQFTGCRRSPPSDPYYFQPMKMLSEFISSASAVAAAQAAGSNPAGQRNTRSSSASSSSRDQLLLREMLCKNASSVGERSEGSHNNNNNKYEYDEEDSPSPSVGSSEKKGKLEGMIGLMMDKLSGGGSDGEPEVAREDNAQENESDVVSSEVVGDGASAQDSNMETSVVNVSTKSSAADLLNNNTQGSTPQQQQRNKRKKYQPQRSDLVELSGDIGDKIDEDLDEFEEGMIGEEDEEGRGIGEEEEEDGRRVTRSQQRRIEGQSASRPTTPTDHDDHDDSPADLTHQKPMITRVKRKLPEDYMSDIDEDEAMLLRQVASGSRSSAATTNPDDAESVTYENEEDEQEAMINDDCQHDNDREQEIGSRRTLPVVRNLMRGQGQMRSVKEAPLTRQLLTSERPTSTPPTNDKHSILRPQMQHRNPTPEINGLPPPSTPPNNFLNQWKDNLKTTLISHINELVDAQFSLLLGGGMIPPGASLPIPPHLQQRVLPPPQQDHDRRSLRESNNPRLEHIKPEQKRTPPPQNTQMPPRSHTPRDIPQQKPLMHLNGGSVLSTDKLMSPPMSDAKKLPVGRATNQDRSAQEYPGIPPRFPFMQNNERSIIQATQQNGKPTHFTNALVGLSNHHLQQQAVAAAVAANAVAAAAGIENMFDNDGALSLVVGNRGNGAGNGNSGQGINDLVHGNVTPRKKRHKVTDTRLTPRAVSRLLGQVDTTPTSSTSPLYDHHPQSSPQSSPHHHNNTPLEPRSILQNGTPPPRSNDKPHDRSTPQSSQPSNDPPRSMFNPFHPPGSTPGFFHPAALAAAAAAGHPIHPSQLRLDSPPMSSSLLHPALQNPSEYVERLREMSMEQNHHEPRNTRVGSDNVVVRDRGEHHHHASLREFPSVRGLRDRGTGGGGIMLSNDVLDLIGRAGSAGGSDSGGESGSGAFELGGGGGGGMYCHTTSTLTPMHLRKAKLMFFWTRYPSSAVIKMYFPDIKFNKNNTAQLVKWFSNFREFYYIQMEKYARQALSEGVKSSEDLVVTTDSELYRVLNLHYNRNNHIEVPTNFRYVVEQTLREFFKSVQAGKDAEQSWKKAIYKIIARLDDPVPEYFKSPNFLEQLE